MQWDSSAITWGRETERKGRKLEILDVFIYFLIFCWNID
jgi:hypothetical protein